MQADASRKACDQVCSVFFKAGMLRNQGTDTAIRMLLIVHGRVWRTAARQPGRVKRSNLKTGYDLPTSKPLA